MAELVVGIDTTEKVPEGYTRLEYIQLDRAYIDTGIVLDTAEKINTAKIHFTAANVQISNNLTFAESGHSNHLFGCEEEIDGVLKDLEFFTGGDGSGEYCYGIRCGTTVANQWMLNYPRNGQDFDSNIVPRFLNKYRYDIDNLQMSITDVDTGTVLGTSTASSVSFGFTNELRINGQNRYPNVDPWYAESYNIARIYDLEIEGIAHMVPAKRNSDNVVGMYDMVRHQFYTATITVDSTGSVSGGYEYAPEVLPSGYTRLKYIENSRGQYIDTGFKLTSSYTRFDFYVKCSVDRGTNPNDSNNEKDIFSNDGCVFGFVHTPARSVIATKSGTDAWNIKHGTISSDVDIIEASGYFTSSKFIDNFTTNPVYRVDSGTNRPYENSKNIYLLKGRTNTNRPYAGKLYRLTFVVDNVTQRDFIPARRNSDNVIGLYDIVNDVFYSNAGTGSFVPGPEYEPATMTVYARVPALVIGKAQQRKYQLLDRVKDDSNNDIGIVTGFFTRPEKVTETYTQLEYLELNGRNCFNTNLYLSKGMDIEYEFMMHDLALADQKNIGGARNGGPETGFQVAYNGKHRSDLNTLVDYFGGVSGDSTGRWSVRASGASEDYALENDVKYKITIINKFGTFYRNGTSMDTHTYNAYGTSPVTVPFYINALNNNGDWTPMNNHWNFYHFKVTESTPGSYPVADIVPVKRNSDNKLGLYDKVNRRFLETLSDGTLISGPETSTIITDPLYGYTKLEYIESSGTQYIDTGYKWTTDITETYIEYFETGSYGCVCGSEYSPSGSNLKYGVTLYGGSSGRGLYVGSSTTERYTFSAPDSWVSVRVKTTSSTAGSISVDYATPTSFSYTGGVQKTYNNGLFCEIKNNIPADYMPTSIRVRRFTLKDNGVTVRDMIPVIRDSDGAIGMLDTVYGVFYGNSGTGSFMAGKIISGDVEYAVVCLNASERTNGKSMFQDNTTKMDGIPTLSIHDGVTIFELPQTATENCDAILKTASLVNQTCQAVSFCRSKNYTIDGNKYYGQIPNAIELRDIYLHASEVNTNDPTASSYPNYTLADGTHTRSQWSSTQTNQWGADLPSVYTELNYLQSSGYIYLEDTTFTTPTSGKIQMKVQINSGNGGTRFIGWCNPSSGSAQNPTDTPMMIASDGNGNNNLYFFYGNNGAQANITTANATYGTNMSVYQSSDAYNYITYVFESGQQKLYMNGYLVGTSSSSNTLNSYNLRLFCASNTTLYTSVVRIYECKIFDENGNLLRNYVPVIKNTNSTLGMYDTVTKRFITKNDDSSITGSFTNGGTKDATGISSIAIRDYGFNGIENNNNKDRGGTYEIITGPVLEIPNIITE